MSMVQYVIAILVSTTAVMKGSSDRLNGFYVMELLILLVWI